MRTRAPDGTGAAPGAGSAAKSAPACISAAECSRRAGRASVCRESGCVALESEGCTLLAEPGDAENDRTIWVGAMLPVSGAQSANGVPDMRAVDLARRDFAQITKGIPSPRGDAPSRPLAVVSCDDSKDPARIAHHLADELRLPAVIGFASSQEVIDLSTSIFLPRRTLVAASVNMSALITSIPHPPGEPRLVWRTVLSSAEVAAPVALMIHDIAEPRAREAAHLAADVDVRLALVRHPSTAGLSFADALLTHVRFNGKSVLENGARFREFVLSEAAEADAGGADEALVNGLVAFRPHVVLAVGVGELTATVFGPVEARWPRAEPRPMWISPNALEGDAFNAFLGKDVERRRRFLGISALASTVANLRFTNRYNETFPEKVSLQLSPAGPYDAMYLIAYAAYLVGDGPLDGAALARNVVRLVPPGKPIEVGPTRILAAIEALRAGQNIDLAGAGNRLDFDLATGESPGDYAVLCVAVDKAGRADGSVASGVTYDPVAQALRGTLACP
jgi:branched-chain amino acid transport system substrate-binding protein